MPTFNIHWTDKNRIRHVDKIRADNPEDAKQELRKREPNVAYINKTKLTVWSSNEAKAS